MLAPLVLEPIALAARSVHRIEDAKGMKVSCVRGVTWITQENDRRDLILASGQSVVLDRPGVAGSAQRLGSLHPMDLVDHGVPGGSSKLACRAAAEGVRRMVGETLATNARMLTLARKVGFTILPSPDVRGLMLLEKPLDAPLPGRLCSGAELSALAA